MPGTGHPRINFQPKNGLGVCAWRALPGPVIALILLLLLVLPHPVCAQRPGLPDSSFGQAGWVRMNLGEDEFCSRMLVDGSGRIVLAGSVTRYAPDADLDYFVARRLPDGAPDLAFGNGGIVVGDFPGHLHSRIVDVALADDGLIFIGEGFTTGALDTQSVYLGKLDDNGGWDADFAQSGLYHRQYVGAFAAAGAVEVLPDGKILYCGATSDTNTWHIEMPMVARLLPDGRPDSTFGGTGMLTWSLRLGLSSVDRIQSSHLSEANRAAHNDGGRFQAVQILGQSYLLGGFFYTGNYSKPMLLQVDMGGLLCDGFGQNGVLFPEINPGLNSRIVGIKRRATDIFIALQSEAYLGGEDMALLQMDTNGTALQYETFDLHQSEDRAQDMLIDRGGRILLSGYSRDHAHNSPGWESDGFAVAARQDLSNWDVDWAIGGRAVFSNGAGLESGAFAMAEAVDGGILVAGYVNDTSPNNYIDLLLLRLQGGGATLAEAPGQGPSLLAYPNPIERGGLLHFSRIVRGKIWIHDLIGRQWELNLEANGLMTYIPELPDGIYILEVADTKIRILIR